MWENRIFKTKEAMQKWIAANDHKTQWHELFVNNAYGVQFRALRSI